MGGREEEEEVENALRILEYVLPFVLCRKIVKGNVVSTVT